MENYCNDKSIRYEKIDNNKEDWKNKTKMIENLNFDMAFVFSFGYMIPSHFIDKVKSKYYSQFNFIKINRV